MENMDDVKIAMDNLIAKMEFDLSLLKQSRNMLNGKLVPGGPTGIVKNDSVGKQFQGVKITDPVLLTNGNQNTLTAKKRGKEKEEIPDVYEACQYYATRFKFILEEKQRVMSEEEFKAEILLRERQDSVLRNKMNFDRTLRGLSNPEKGEWTYFTFTRGGIKFYVKPEWIDKASRTVLLNRRTDVTLSGLNPVECDWNKVLWHRDK